MNETAVAHSPRRSAAGLTWAAFAIGLAAFSLALFVGPRVPNAKQNDLCVFNVPLIGPFGVSLNCDSTDFMRFARDPKRLLEPHNVRQSRPGLILAAAVLTLPLSPMRDLAIRLKLHGERTDIETQRMANSLLDNVPAYIPYIGFNFAFLLLSFHYLQQACRPLARRRDPWTILALSAFGLMIVASDVVKAFLWSPHTQMLNILVPVLAINVVLQSWDGAMLNRRFVLWIGLLTGFGITAYGVFAVLVPCVLLPALADWVRRRAVRNGRQLAINAGIFLILALGPMTLWYAFVRLYTGDFYQVEISDYRQVLWMADALAIGPDEFIKQWVAVAKGMLDLAKPLTLDFAAAAAVTLGAVIATGRGSGWVVGRAAAVVSASLLVTAAMFVFYVCTGFLIYRFACSFIPGLLVATAAIGLSAMRELPKSGRAAVAICYLAIALAQMTYVVVKDGPWS